MQQLRGMTGCFADEICLILETGNAAVTASLKQWHVTVLKFVEMAVFFAYKTCLALELQRF